MNQFSHTHTWCSKLLLCLVGFALITSFGLHSVQVVHSHSQVGQHQGHTDSKSLELNEYLHASDRKILFIIATIFLFAAGFEKIWSDIFRLFVARIEITYRVLIRTIVQKRLTFQNYLNLFFARGILHPKSY